MNPTVVVFLVLAVSLMAAQERAEWDYNATDTLITASCAIEHRITPEQMDLLHAPKNQTYIEIPENLKCFTRCTALKAGLVVWGVGIDSETLVTVGVAKGKDETKVREALARCKSLYKGEFSCDEYWDLHICFNSD